MKFYSTKHQAPDTDVKEAVLRSLPADNGLYMPETLTPMSEDYWKTLSELSFEELSYQFAQNLLQESVPAEALKKIVYDAVNFEAPLVELEENLSCLELFHGPSLAFKDFGARFMSRLMSHLVEEGDQKLDILVATSGDTGGAVALGFYKTPNIRVTILYPSGKVSLLQEKQLTTLGENIRAVEVQGTFDDCQKMVKTAFLDEELKTTFNLSSANSINIARLIPQTFYYIRAYQQTKDKNRPLAMCVPSGNFGNITAGLIAKKMGLPIQKFIASNNSNDVFYNYLKTGTYEPRPSVRTHSNAMDVGNPSNFQRIQDLYKGSVEALRKDMAAYSFDDAATLAAIKEMYEKYNYVACPHTAVGYLGAKAFQEENPEYQVIFQATAHAAKFIDVVEDTLQQKIDIPADLEKLRDRPKSATLLSTEFEDFKKYLLDRG